MSKVWWKLQRYLRWGTWPKDDAYMLWRHRKYGDKLPEKPKRDHSAGLPDTAAYWQDIRG